MNDKSHMVISKEEEEAFDKLYWRQRQNSQQSRKEKEFLSQLKKHMENKQKTRANVILDVVLANDHFPTEQGGPLVSPTLPMLH